LSFFLLRAFADKRHASAEGARFRTVEKRFFLSSRLLTSLSPSGAFVKHLGGQQNFGSAVPQHTPLERPCLRLFFACENAEEDPHTPLEGPFRPSLEKRGGPGKKLAGRPKGTAPNRRQNEGERRELVKRQRVTMGNEIVIAFLVSFCSKTTVTVFCLLMRSWTSSHPFNLTLKGMKKTQHSLTKSITVVTQRGIFD
jgi:hypothetical protein